MKAAARSGSGAAGVFELKLKPANFTQDAAPALDVVGCSPRPVGPSFVVVHINFVARFFDRGAGRRAKRREKELVCRSPLVARGSWLVTRGS